MERSRSREGDEKMPGRRGADPVKVMKERRLAREMMKERRLAREGDEKMPGRRGG